MKALTSDRVRHLILRADVDDVLPDFLKRELRANGVTCGWLRAGGVLNDVELRAYGSDVGAQGVGRRIVGPVHVVSLEGSVGVANGDVSVGMRAVLARETDRGMEALAGEILSARVVALEGMVTVFEDLIMPRVMDADAGTWLFGEGGAMHPPPRNPAPDLPAPAPSKPATPAWSDAAAASTAVTKERPNIPASLKPAFPAVVMPQRPARPVPVDSPSDDGPFPAVGDMVEHFAFGTCEVIKSDGDRLHVKVHKDGRVREIALEMLRVTLLTTEGDGQRYRLDRRL